MASILIAYSTTDGHTGKICQRLRQVAEGEPGGHAVTVAEIARAEALDLRSFDTIVIGASIRYGKHSPQVVSFVERNRALLESRKNAFFSVNVVARKPEKSTPETNPYLRKFLQGIAWKPRALDVFAGRIDYPDYGWFDRAMIRLIMWMTKGPTDPTARIEFTDWGRVEAFGKRLAAM